MAYFSNGTEGQMYQEKYCQRCVHDVDENCPILLLHLIHNGDEGADEFLDVLIPRSKDGVSNEKCTMFVLADEQTPILPRPVIADHVRKINGVPVLVF